MFPLVLLYCGGVNLIITAATPYADSKDLIGINPGIIVADAISHNISSSYFDRDENSIRVPDIKFEDKKKQKAKKSPKRTIQKIIKRKKKQKRRFMLATSRTTKATEQVHEDPNYQEEDEPTTKPNRPNRQRKKQDKKWRNALATIYPRKSRRKQRNVNIRTYARKNDKKKEKKLKNKKRLRRDLGRELFILKDLDETEIYEQKNPNELMIKAHMKKYW